MKTKKLYITKIHCIMEIVSFLLILLALVIVIVRAVKAGGEEIPIHFDIEVEPNGYGSPWELIILPIMIFICNGMTSLLIHFMPPSSWNMPVKIKPGKELVSYRLATTAVTGIELCLSIFAVVFTAFDFSGMLFPLLLLGLLTLVIIVPIVKIVRVNRT